MVEIENKIVAKQIKLDVLPSVFVSRHVSNKTTTGFSNFNNEKPSNAGLTLPKSGIS